MGCSSSIWFCCPLYFLFHSSISMSFPSPSPPSSNSSWCHPDESTALLHFKNSFSFGTIPENFYCDNEVQVSIRKTWQNGTDCCTWSGVKCDKVTHKVISLDLHCSWLQGNNTLHGPVPSSIFQQVNLEYLRLTRNKLSGVIGLDQFSKLKNVYHLGLSYNDLSLNSNNFINYTLPYDLDVLALSSCNISEFPYALRVSERLRYLDLSYNRIQGNIPKWLWNVGKEKLFYLNLSHNLLTDVGKLPWKGLKLLDLRFNLIQGRLPIPPPSTNIFFISNNQLTGEIPYSICSLTSLRFLDLSYNNLNGSIPLCVGNFSDILSVMNLRMNMLDGMIPTTFAKGNNTLRNINLSGNRLEGPVPRSLLNCRNLEILDLGNNMINDTFPQWLESLPMLQVLVLRCNKFHGSIDTLSVIRFPFPKLRIMDLSNNQLNGVLPRQYFETFSAMLDGHVDKLRYMGQNFYAGRYYQDSVSVTIKGFDVELENIQNIFTAIDFSRNNFKGKIPKSIGNLKGLKGLNFSHNKISGHIPRSLRNLTNLEWLDLSCNKLSGKIPGQLTEMTSLEVLNLSQNQLAGAIPRGNQFGTFDNASYIGNPGLCGFPLSKTCENDRAQQPPPSKGDHLEAANGFDWKFAILLGYGCGLVIGISVGYMLFSDKRLACFIRKVGGERWIELLKARKKKKKKAHFNTRRRNR
ncbi:receptor like protein 22-like isoform X2 [Ziziphus jujuba]|uniref:Receptor like protein 22-like isoform X2 n=1 Tax=Ziziphus jujuba TaxID=326968 RepID=A0ABM4AFC6_ZIZJJ|nr:receptor like protein 22-like isoform X2 [Ziziphus jujuba]